MAIRSFFKHAGTRSYQRALNY